jgi:hypothetical protein
MLIELNYPIDRVQLLCEANDLRGYKPFIAREGVIHSWLIKNPSTGYAKEAADAFRALIGSTMCLPRFYRQAPGYYLDFHKDYGTQCSLNVLLSENPDPISFENGDVHYRTALLNTQELHAVKNTTSTRILFKISVMDKTFAQVKDALERYIGTQEHITSVQS